LSWVNPTQLIPVAAHKCIYMGKVVFQGRSGHASDPANGQSALHAALDWAGMLQDWYRLQKESYIDPGFSVPMPTLNIGEIRGGDAPNKICDLCELTFDYRTLPAQEQEELFRFLETSLPIIRAKYQVGSDWRHLFSGLPPLRPMPDQALHLYLEQLTGQSCQAVNYGTEAPFYQKMGIPAFILGPGGITQAHSPEESIDPAELELAVSYYGQMILDHCVL